MGRPTDSMLVTKPNELELAVEQADDNIEAEVDAVTSRFTATRSVDIVIGALVGLFTLGLVFMIIRRKDLQPIKVKGWRLVTISLVGNAFSILGQLFVKANYSRILEDREIVIILNQTQPFFGAFAGGPHEAG